MSKRIDFGRSLRLVGSKSGLCREAVVLGFVSSTHPRLGAEFGGGFLISIAGRPSPLISDKTGAIWDLEGELSQHFRLENAPQVVRQQGWVTYSDVLGEKHHPVDVVLTDGMLTDIRPATMEPEVAHV